MARALGKEVCTLTNEVLGSYEIFLPLLENNTKRKSVPTSFKYKENAADNGHWCQTPCAT